MSDAQETDARQQASVFRTLAVTGSTLASARSWATQSSEQLVPRRDSVSFWSESSYVEGVLVTTYRQVNDMQKARALMPASAVSASSLGCEVSVCVREGVKVETCEGAGIFCGQGLEATPVDDYPRVLTNTSKGSEEALASVGHLPAEGHYLALECCTRRTERDPGIGQLEPEGSLWDGGVTEYTTFQISESGFGRAFVSAMGGAYGSVGAMVSESCCKTAEGREQVPCRSDGAGLGTSGQVARFSVAVQGQPSSDLSYHMTGLESVVLRGDHQPVEGCGADGYSGNGYLRRFDFHRRSHNHMLRKCSVK